jgi:5-methylcytosine-specific restriction protein A
MQRGAKAEEVAWQRYAGDEAALRAETERILAALQLTAEFAGDLAKDDDPYEAEEGSVQMRAHRYYERDRGLIRRKKAEAAKRGPLSCEACGFNFERRYGQIGDGFIEVHHCKPVHLMKPGEKTRMADLALLCSNCHRVAHRRRPPLELKEIQDLVTPLPSDG